MATAPRLPRLALLACLILPLLPAPGAQAQTEIQAEALALTRDPALLPAMVEAAEAHGLPALGAAVITEGSIRFNVMGVIKVGSEEAVLPGDLFHLGSCGKAVTAFVALQLEAEGALSLEDRLEEVLPELAQGARRRYRGVTLGDLLSHRAGLPAYTDRWERLADLSGSPSAQRRALAARALRTRPERLRGDAFHYSNAGYALAALMMEAKTGQPWEQLVVARMAALGIDAQIGFPNARDPGAPWGHERGEDGVLRPVAADAYGIPPALAPAGDIAMSIEGYARFIQLNLRGLMGMDGPLPPEAFQRMHYGREGYGLGFFNGRIQSTGERISDHAGSADTYLCYVILLPARGLALAFMTNSADSDDREGLDTLRNASIKAYSPTPPGAPTPPR